MRVARINSHGLPVLEFAKDRMTRRKPFPMLTYRQLGLRRPRIFNAKECKCPLHTNRHVADEINEAYRKLGNLRAAVEDVAYAPRGDDNNQWAWEMVNTIAAELAASFIPSVDTGRRKYAGRN